MASTKYEKYTTIVDGYFTIPTTDTTSYSFDSVKLYPAPKTKAIDEAEKYLTTITNRIKEPVVGTIEPTYITNHLNLVLTTYEDIKTLSGIKIERRPIEFPTLEWKQEILDKVKSCIAVWEYHLEGESNELGEIAP